MPQLLLLLHALATWYMVGLIWMVQIVHYPMFDRVGSDQFAQYEKDHSRLITPIVGIPMLIELGTAVALLCMPGFAPITYRLIGVGLVIIVAIWLVTATLSVPCHQQLAAGFNATAHQKLVLTNWLRTLGWTVRGGIVAWILYQQLQAASPTVGT